MSLVETQRRIRRAVVDADSGTALSMLVGGPDPRTRLAIHQRHYETSLVTALLNRFPATGWLVGSAQLLEPARSFIRQRPPRAPCIAEYGRGFPDWLRTSPVANRVPYLSAFAEFDWHLGRVAVEVEQSPVEISTLAAVPPTSVPDVQVMLQPGLHYLSANWPIDELMRLFVTNTAPDRLTQSSESVWLEIRGARGDFSFHRLAESDFTFRLSLCQGGTLGASAERALGVDATFDPGPAVAGLFTAGLAVGATNPAGV